MTPILFNRVVNLIMAAVTLVMCLAWMRRNRLRWLYLFPALWWLLHSIIFTASYLLAFFNAWGLVFDLAFFDVWGSFNRSHAIWTVFFCVLVLLTGRFRRIFPGWIIGGLRG